MINRFLRYLLMIICVDLFIVACDQDPFHQSYREIGQSYYLHRWEDGETYYLERQSNDTNQEQGGGVINGTVEKIGWNANYILVKRQSTYVGDSNGWMLLDAQGTQIKGPYTSHDIEQLPEIKEIKVLNPDEAWEKLGSL